MRAVPCDAEERAESESLQPSALVGRSHSLVTLFESTIVQHLVQTQRKVKGSFKDVIAP